MRCPFCSLKHMEWVEQKYEFMDFGLFEQIVDELSVWHPKHRFEIAARGEPTLYPQFMEAISYARAKLPKAQILVTTNTDIGEKMGWGDYRNWIAEAQNRGVNVFMLDAYSVRRLETLRETFSGLAQTFFDDKFNPYPYRHPKFKAVVIKDATVGKQNVILRYHNQGGNAVVTEQQRKVWDISVLNEPLRRMCVRPFREFPIHYDGTVPLCCDDWRQQQVIGKYPDKPLSELWDLYDPLREALLQKDRSHAPCNKCSERSGMRSGLEFDWFKDNQK